MLSGGLIPVVLITVTIFVVRFTFKSWLFSRDVAYITVSALADPTVKIKAANAARGTLILSEITIPSSLVLKCIQDKDYHLRVFSATT